MAIIPTEWGTENYCYEIKGRIKNNNNGSNNNNNNENNEFEGNEENDFLVYINAETGKEEDILMIVNTPNGTLTT